MSEIRHILNEARHEIIALRRRNEILGAKVEVFESMMCLLHTRPAEHNQPMSPDIAWQIEKAVEAIDNSEGIAGVAK